MFTRASALRSSFILVVAIAVAVPAVAQFAGTWTGNFYYRDLSPDCTQTGVMTVTASNSGSGTMTLSAISNPSLCADVLSTARLPFRGAVSGNVITAATVTPLYTFTLTNSTRALFFSDLDDGAFFYATLFLPVRPGPQRANVDGVWTGRQSTDVVYCDAVVTMTGDVNVTLERTGGNTFSGTLSPKSERDSELCVLLDTPADEFTLDLSGTMAGNTFIGKATYPGEPFEAAVAGTITGRNTIDIEVTAPTNDPDGSNQDEPLDSILRATLTRSAPVINTFSAAATSITAGSSTDLSWTTTNAAGVTLQRAAVAVQGTASVTPLGTTVYRLVATGPGGAPATSTVTVTVTP